MPQSEARARRSRADSRKSKSNRRGKTGPRYSVGLPSSVVREVEKYAATADTSMSKAIAALVRIGLDTQVKRKREFFDRLKANLANDDPKEQDRLVEEFRNLIMGR